MNDYQSGLRHNLEIINVFDENNKMGDLVPKYNIQDWCISRQLWWGHRIPAYYCEECGHINVAKEMPEKCEKCGSTHLHQDEDTLDTWFSSALWPFSTLGWPNTETEDYKTFYPTNVLVTGFDIITFWVSRMMSQGLELTGKAPFKDVLIHGMVRDSQGRKMSKTLGNGIDPIEIIDKYGADSLRFAVISGTTMGNDIRYMPEKLEQASNFANKIWNAAKFIINSSADEEKALELHKELNREESKGNTSKTASEKLRIEDKWLLNKFDKLVAEVSRNLENYDLGVALDKIYSVTSEIYSKLICFDTEDLIVAEWPEAKATFEFDEEEEFVESLKEIITEIRNVRANANIHPSKKSELIFVTDKYEKEILEAQDFILKLGFGEKILVQKDKIGIPENAISILRDGIELYIPLEQLVDIEEEKARLEEEIKRLEGEVARCEKMLSNPGFVNKAPEAKVQEEKDKLANYTELLKANRERLENLK